MSRWLKGLIDSPWELSQPTGNRLEVQFTLGGHETYLYYNDSSTRDVQENGFYQAGVYVDGTRVAGSESLVARSAVGTTQVVSITLSDLAGLVGKIAAGAVATAGEVRAYAQVPGTFNQFETATADAALKLPVTTCK